MKICAAINRNISVLVRSDAGNIGILKEEKTQIQSNISLILKLQPKFLWLRSGPSVSCLSELLLTPHLCCNFIFITANATSLLQAHHQRRRGEVTEVTTLGMVLRK